MVNRKTLELIYLSSDVFLLLFILSRNKVVFCAEYYTILVSYIPKATSGEIFSFWQMFLVSESDGSVLP